MFSGTGPEVEILENEALIKVVTLDKEKERWEGLAKEFEKVARVVCLRLDDLGGQLYFKDAFLDGVELEMGQTLVVDRSKKVHKFRE